MTLKNNASDDGAIPSAKIRQRLRKGAACLVAVVGLILCRVVLADAGAMTWDSVFAWIDRDWPEVPQMTTEELARQLAGTGEKPVLVDTRTREEYEISHLPQAIWAETPALIREALRGVALERQVVLYCSVGVRSSKAAAALMKDGRTRVSNLRGSIFQWANEGRAVERDGKAVAVVHPYNKKWGALLDGKLHAEAAR